MMSPSSKSSHVPRYAPGNDPYLVAARLYRQWLARRLREVGDQPHTRRDP